MKRWMDDASVQHEIIRISKYRETGLFVGNPTNMFPVRRVYVPNRKTFQLLLDKMNYDEVNGLDKEEMIKKYGEENVKLYLEFFENLEDVRMLTGDYFEIVEKMEEKLGRELSDEELDWVDEVCGDSEEEV